MHDWEYVASKAFQLLQCGTISGSVAKELALQLPTCFEMRTLSGGLVRSAPE